MQHVFTHAGYKFWVDSTGRWNVTKVETTEPPTHCAYATPKAIADLKGVDLSNVVGFTV